MAQTPPPYVNITGISRTVMKDNAQETLAGYDGSARPGEIVADLTQDPPALYVGNNAGQLTALATGGGGNTTPGGSNTQIQFNAAGTFGGDSDLTWNSSTNLLTVTGNIAGGNVAATGNVSAANLVGLTLFTDFAEIATTLRLGDDTGETPLIAANAASGTVSLTTGVAGQVLISAGASRTPYWGNIANTTSTYGNANVAAYLPTYTGNLAGGNLAITGAVSFPNIQEDTTGTSPLLLWDDTNGDVGWDSTIYYDHANEELHIGNLVLNDNVTGATIGLDEQDQDLQFTVNRGGSTREVFRLVGSEATMKLFPGSGAPPTSTIGSFYFNNDANELSGVGLYFCANVSSGNAGWQQVNLT